MVHTKASSGKKDEPEAAPSWTIGLLYAPLLLAAMAVLALIVTLHLMYKPWLLDSHYRHYTFYIASAVTVAAFLMCCCIAFCTRRKQMYARLGCVTARTRLLDGKTYLPLYVDVEAPPAKTSTLPVKFVAPPENTAKPSAG
ncbi:uncharacterized protein LOC126416064 [Schistocerca serialis cubense]|uniref:uncharacterized protein LOC126416064 n=2 Tax=Schistocerca TaxID=7008 RepID=UPI00214F5F46|nr:uncharacterized protein LOC126416064 [Schistocerca serialis cubense]